MNRNAAFADGSIARRRPGKRWFAAWGGIAALFISLLGVRGEVVWFEGFEGGAPEWTVEGGIWEIGIPNSQPLESGEFSEIENRTHCGMPASISMAEKYGKHGGPRASAGNYP
jgi:hypothetical protein